MVFPVVFAPGVFEDEQEAFDHYDRERSGLGDEFLVHLDQLYDTLASNLETFGYADERKVLRRARTARFPYVILYEARSSEVLVARLFHEKQDVRY